MPGVTAATKAQYLPLHVTAGVLCIVLPVATSGIGFMVTLLPPPFLRLLPNSPLSRALSADACVLGQEKMGFVSTALWPRCVRLRLTWVP